MARIGMIALLLLAAVVSLPALDFEVPAAAQRPAGVGAPNAPRAGTSAAPAAAPAKDPASISPVSPSAAAPGKSSLSNLEWLTGRWQGQWGQRVAELDWMPPKAGFMLGTLRLVENGKTLVLELFALTEKPGGLVELRLRHFTPDLVPWEKAGPELLKLSSADHNQIVFENHVDGQPKRAVFARVDDDTCVLRNEIVPEKGTLQVTEITYHRQKPAASAPKPHHWFGSGSSPSPE